MPLSPAQLTPLDLFASDVKEGLCRPVGRRAIPSRYFYDHLGSALFEAITLLPEYGLTRADERILAAHAPDIVAAAGPVTLVAELGSGTGTKTRRILEQAPGVPYFPIDVSAGALAFCHQTLSPLSPVHVIEAGYLEGLAELASRRAPHSRLLLLFLGSSIGNFDAESAVGFLSAVRCHLRPGDSLLLGTDLMQDPERLIPAYDDPLGVTASFNRNLLVRINRDLDGDFDIRSFDHVARYNASQHRMEMFLRPTKDQQVHIRALSLHLELEAGEMILTEVSHKYSADELPLMAAASGFRHTAAWSDAEWPFAESLWLA